MRSTISAPPPLRFTAEDSQRAHGSWGANCGPHALAAASGKSLEEVRAICFPNGFRGYMNPTMMNAALTALTGGYGVWRGGRVQELRNGIHRVQWEGPWLNPGVPARAAYQHTHYIAACDGFVLCTAVCPYAWITAEDWRGHNRARGDGWFITHRWVYSGFFKR